MRWFREQFWPVVRRTADEWSEDDGNRLAASLAYYGVLSLFPLLLVFISAFGYVLRLWPALKDMLNLNVVDFIRDKTSADVAEEVDKVVQKMLNELQSNAVFGGPLGLLVLLIAAIGIFTALEDSLYKIWKVKNAPRQGGIGWMILHVLLHRLKAFVMLLSMGGLMVTTFIASFVLSIAQKQVEGWPIPPAAWSWLHLLVGISLNGLFLTLIYKLLAKGPVRWPTAALGGILTSIGWEAGRAVLALFLIGDKYNAYDIVGALIAVMLWFYYASTILLLGAEVIQVVTRRRQEAEGKAGLELRTD